MNTEEALYQQTLDLLRQERQLDELLLRFFEKYEELVERHLDARTPWGRQFHPLLEGAYASFRQHGARETRVELARFSEAPMMDVE